MIVTIVIVTTTVALAIGSYALGYYNANKDGKVAYMHYYQISLKTFDATSEAFTKDIFKRVRSKLDVVNEIMNAQLSLWASIDGPNRGASHTKWKSGLIHEINDLEAEKIDAFRDVISNGVDLAVIVMNSDGGRVEKKMSEIVNDFDISQAPTPFTPKQPVNKNDSNKKLNVVKPKLSLIKDDTNDGQST